LTEKDYYAASSAIHNRYEINSEAYVVSDAVLVFSKKEKLKEGEKLTTHSQNILKP